MKMEIIQNQEKLGLSTIIYASMDEAKLSPEIIRLICERGPSIRRKALGLGIISQDLFDKANLLPVFGEVAIGCGYKDFSFISHKSLHAMYKSAFISLKIVENGKVILSA